jgi:hypothetical protein
MGTVSAKDFLTNKEIGAVMCAVADDNAWRRGKRGYMVVSRDLFGIKLMVRYKPEASLLALTSDDWRIAFNGFVHKNELFDKPERVFKVPFMHYPQVPGSRHFQHKEAATIIREIGVMTVDFDIKSEKDFDRDWTLLRLFSSEWAEYAT